MRSLILLLALMTTSHSAHATPLDNGDLFNTISANIAASRVELVVLSHEHPSFNLESLAHQLILRGELGQAVWILETLRNKRDKAMLATAYSRVGRHEEAIRYAEEVLAARRGGPLENSALAALGNIYREAGQFEQALALQEENLRSNLKKWGQSGVYTYLAELHLGDTYTALGQYNKASGIQQRLVDFWSKQSGPDSKKAFIPMRGLANSLLASGRPEQALPLLERCLEEWSKETPNQISQITAEFDLLLAKIALARAQHDLGRMDKARALIPDIIKETERLRADRPRTAEYRQIAFAMFSDIYQQMAVWSAGAGEIEEAFNIGDLSKARTLAEGIRTQAALRALLPAEQQALQDMGKQSQELRNKLNAAHLRSLKDDKELKAIEGELKALRDRFEKATSQLPLAAEFPEIDVPSARLARNLLGKNEVFINYLVSSEGVRPHLRFKAGAHERVEPVQKNKAQAFIVDGTGAIRWIDLGRLPNLAQTVAAYRELMTSHDAGQLPGRLVALQEGGYQWVEKGQAAPAGSRPEPVPAGSTPATHALRLLQRYWHDTLIRPVLPLAGAHSRWIISPDKDLALLPFDTLPETFTAKGESDKLLAEQRNITLVQSFSVYALLKKREADYAALPRSRTLLAMGNPIYDSGGWAENRGLRRGTGKRGFTASGEAASPGVAAAALVENAEQRAMAGLKWENLPGTAEEIRRITDVFGGTTGGVDGLTGADASEGKLRELNNSGKLKDYRYLLFSAHGYLAKNPTLSSLVLSQHGNPAGLDGYVTAGEWPLYDVRSDLTVLSACDTGVGKVQAGESVLGLPYALFVAGNRNTLLSLWPVADEATAEFMALFFGKLKQGKSQPVALSETKQDFMRHPTWSKPVFWAAFVLYGV